MMLPVPYIADETIERDAEALLAQFAHARGVAIRAPIPIEDIIEKHLKLHVEFDDLHRLLEIPRGGFGTEPDIFGAIWLEAGEIVIDESLDPEVRPTIEGRYRFTLGHEGGHWRLHRPLVEANGGQESLFGDTQQPTVVCLSMPRKLVFCAWRDRFGNDHPRTLRREDRMVVPCGVCEETAAVVRSFDQARDDEVLEHFARPLADQFM